MEPCLNRVEVPLSHRFLTQIEVLSQPHCRWKGQARHCYSNGVFSPAANAIAPMLGVPQLHFLFETGSHVVHAGLGIVI